jgi:3'-phosphoadenosine 5'-phosphosulfate sulfotransferase (PAPS reductase)/FAD synthetase
VKKENPQLGLDIPDLPMPPYEPKENTLYHVGVSGGKDSAAALLWMIHESGIPKEKITATFCDIGNDHEWTLQHVKLLSETVHPIYTIYPDLDFFELAEHKRRFPSTKARFCTEFLKILPTKEHVTKLRYQGFDVVAVSGVRADESEDRKHLSEWAMSRTLGCYSWRPLIRWTIGDVLAIHKKYNVPMNPLYALGAQRVGCWPCIMSNKAELRTIALQFPKRIDEIRSAEQKFEIENGRYSSFFPRTHIPPRFRSKPFVTADGRKMNIATIDDVVKWSMTGHRAKGTYLDNPEKTRTCQSGYCE